MQYLCLQFLSQLKDFKELRQLLFNRCCKVCPTSIRAILQIIMWVGFCVYMFWQLFFVLDDFEVKNDDGIWQINFEGKDAVNNFTLYVVITVVISMITQFISDFWLSINDEKDENERNKTKLKLWWFNVNQDYVSTRMNISWPNLLSFKFFIFEIIQLTALPIFVLTQLNILKEDAGVSDNVSYLANNGSWNRFANLMQAFLFIYQDHHHFIPLYYLPLFVFLYIYLLSLCLGHLVEKTKFCIW